MKTTSSPLQLTFKEGNLLSWTKFGLKVQYFFVHNVPHHLQSTAVPLINLSSINYVRGL